MSPTFDEDAHKGLISIVFTRYFQVSIVALTFNIDRVHPIIIVIMSAKYDEEEHNGLISIWFSRSKRDGHKTLTVMDGK